MKKGEKPMSDIRNLLTAKDYSLIDKYREIYTSDEQCYHIGDNMIPSFNLLSPWSEAKSKFLTTLFGNQLILSREVSLHKSYDELCDDEITYEHIYRLDQFIYQINKSFRALYANNTVTTDEFHILCHLVTPDALLANEYSGVNVKIGNYRLNHGCKLMKALKQLNGILHFMNDNEFEEFRICQSMCTNTTALEGKLCLSIHPLDYMTMSDNACDWSSCMSWQENGCYRMGTVEMMNSPCVIVAYLESSHPMYISREAAWNSKKWRSLYIVTPDIVANVKAYPYYDSSIDKIVTNWLYELMVTACPNHIYEKPYTFEYPMIGSTRVRFETDLMYNDCCSNTKHWGFRRKGIGDSLLVNYSGDAQCMICGNTDRDSLKGDSLACEVCEPDADIWYCDKCGCRLTEDEIFFINDGDIPLCSDCYQEYSAHDCVTHEDGWRNEMIPIIYMPASLMNHSYKDAIAYLDEYIRLREAYDVQSLYLTSPVNGIDINWDVHYGHERQEMYDFMMAHSYYSFDELCKLWEKEKCGNQYEMTEFLLCWTEIKKRYTNNHGADLGLTSTEGITIKSIFLYKGYLVINTAAMDSRLKEACQDAFFYTDCYVYANKRNFNNASVYDWFNYSGLLDATDSNDFDF